MEPGGYASVEEGKAMPIAGEARNLAAHSTLSSPAAPALLPGYAPAELSGAGEPAKPCNPGPGLGVGQGGPPAPLPCGYLGGGCCSCRGGRGSLKPSAQGASFPPDKYPTGSGAGEDYPSRAPEFSFYPGYPGPCQPVAGYLDVSVVQGLGAPGEPRHDPLLDSYSPWALAGGWNGQRCCPSDPSPAGPFWKPPFAETAGPLPPDSCSFRRGRKKRIPYSKAQLRELEREFAASKFITKDKRRKISAATSLSERQITIWFQNRRVKEKKVLAKVKSSAIP
ncbi:homeobox protein Hox-B13 [Ornithorhynchus anatinus]|uniref:Homeobox B13 n=1 Tax=Ornithorhynchus anatinus TaxID=9258 RepID=F6VCP2_ORNAN|nr:homeobox protein Hox-B13 [Ornithorhynchus anatinus]